jgi:hypothetical protein
LRFMSTGTPAEQHGPRRVCREPATARWVREKPKAVPNHEPLRPYAQKL